MSEEEIVYVKTNHHRIWIFKKPSYHKYFGVYSKNIIEDTQEDNE